MLQGSSWFQPDALFGIFIMQEEAILVGMTKTFDFGYAFSDVRTGVQNRGL